MDKCPFSGGEHSPTAKSLCVVGRCGCDLFMHLGTLEANQKKKARHSIAVQTVKAPVDPTHYARVVERNAELSTKYKETTRSLSASRKEVETLETEILQKAREEASGKAKWRLQVATLEGELKTVRSKLKKSRKKLTALAGVNKQLSDKKTLLEFETVSLKEEFAAIRQDYVTLTTAVEELSNHNKHLKQTNLTLAHMFREYRSKHASLNAKFLWILKAAMGDSLMMSREQAHDILQIQLGRDPTDSEVTERIERRAKTTFNALAEMAGDCSEAELVLPDAISNAKAFKISHSALEALEERRIRKEVDNFANNTFTMNTATGTFHVEEKEEATGTLLILTAKKKKKKNKKKKR